MHAVPLTKSSFAASRKPTQAERGINALAKQIVGSREVFKWDDFKSHLHRYEFTLLGMPAEYKQIVADNVQTFRLASLSEDESAAKFNEMRILFNELCAEYDAGGGAAILYCMIRIIMLAIIAVQRTMVLKACKFESPALRFVEGIDNDGRLRTERMQTTVTEITFQAFQHC